MEVIESSLKVISPTLKSNMISVELVLKESQIKIHIFVNEIKQVVLCILKNSEDILSEMKDHDSKIWINGYEEKGNTFLTIEDNAGGIPENIIGNVFDPYFSTKTKKDGTGLGLYMSKIIIEEHRKGKLSVTNTQCGAKFTIQLPMRFE